MTKQLLTMGSFHSVDHMLAFANRVPLLSATEEQDLAHKVIETQDKDAARVLLLSQLRYVIHIAKSYMGYGLPVMDLVQEGNIGLMKALKRFNPNQGVRLITFAIHWIRSEIQEFIVKNWRLVKIATTKAQRKLFFNLRKLKSSWNWLTAQETENMAKQLGVSPKEVSHMEERLYHPDLAYDMPLDAEEQDGLSPEEYLHAENDDPSHMLATVEESQQKTDKLHHFLTQLDARSQDIIQKRWLNADKLSLDALSQQHGISMERVRQLEKKALKQLHAWMTQAPVACLSHA